MSETGGNDAYGFLDAARGSGGTGAAGADAGRGGSGGAGIPGIGRRPGRTGRARRGRRNKAQMKRATGFVRADVYRQAVRAMEDMEYDLRRDLRIGDEPLQFGHLIEMLLVEWLESVGRPVDEEGR